MILYSLIQPQAAVLDPEETSHPPDPHHLFNFPKSRAVNPSNQLTVHQALPPFPHSNPTHIFATVQTSPTPHNSSTLVSLPEKSPSSCPFPPNPGSAKLLPHYFHYSPSPPIVQEGWEFLHNSRNAWTARHLWQFCPFKLVSEDYADYSITTAARMLPHRPLILPGFKNDSTTPQTTRRSTFSFSSLKCYPSLSLEKYVNTYRSTTTPPDTSSMDAPGASSPLNTPALAKQGRGHHDRFSDNAAYRRYTPTARFSNPNGKGHYPGYLGIWDQTPAEDTAERASSLACWWDYFPMRASYGTEYNTEESERSSEVTGSDDGMSWSGQPQWDTVNSLSRIVGRGTLPTTFTGAAPGVQPGGRHVKLEGAAATSGTNTYSIREDATEISYRENDIISDGH